MTLPPLRSTNQPFLRHWLLGLLAALASLQLAVALIGMYAAVVAWATFVEREYGAAAARFGIYDSAWFAGLNALLGANILCSMLIRFPWRRRQSGFVVTHTGILVLLVGCLVSQRSGVEAHLSIFEGRAAYRAYQDSCHFELQVAPADPAPTVVGEVILVPFVPGPFNWDRYAKLSWFPWRLAYRSRGTVFDEDGMRLEVLDYAAERQPAARVRLTVEGVAKEFTLAAAAEDSRSGELREVVEGKGRRVAITLVPDEVDLGFQVFLHKFHRKLDPGSEMASHYSSLVDFIDRSDLAPKLKENVLITLNAPVDIADPPTGRTYRLFQSSYLAPGMAGYAELVRQVVKDRSGDQPYLSTLSVNYDPGRGLKYSGCLLIVAGIVMVYCLRAYFSHKENNEAVSSV